MIPDTKTNLSIERTYYASERTLMAWVRTSVSLVGFGFSIPKFFSLMVDLGRVTPEKGIFRAEVIGIYLMALGTFGLMGGLWQHFRILRSYKQIRGLKRLISPVVFVSAGVLLLSLIGPWHLVFNNTPL